MTELQLGLLVIGAAAVAGVLVYNRIQERGRSREAQRTFESRHADVLADDASARREPTLEPLPARPAPPPGKRPDPRVDYIIQLSGAPPASLRHQWRALEQRFGGRAILYEANEVPEAALQLVSRGGVLSEGELLEFRSQIETLAASLGAAVSAPEMREALDGAKAFDRACAEVDVQIAMHVLGPSQQPPEDDAFQVVRRPDGGVTFLLDVPRTAKLTATYEAMVRCARQLGGRMVDDNGNVLDERALAAIGAELEALRARLVELNVEPGSPLALRLFS